MKLSVIAPRLILSVLLAIVGVEAGPVRAFADQVPAIKVPAGLSFAEVKMTGNEFLVLTNNSPAAIPDLSVDWLYNFNKANPQTAGASTTTQQLPATPLSPGASLLLSDGGATCGAQAAAKLNVNLTDSGGTLQLLASTPAGLILPAPLDQVSWSSGASGDIQNVPSSRTDGQAAYYRTGAGGSYSWVAADVDTSKGYANPCQLNVATGNGQSTVQAIGQTDNRLLPPGSPPATIVSVAATTSGDAAPHLPADDAGLAAPGVSELLPNPAGTGTDATDEFIELYNSNATVFDLSGFTLETGVSTKHKYIFPAGSTLPAKGFKAFYSAQTGLSLSNTSGQAALLDPFGKVVSQSDPYEKAKDGMAWAAANGTWYWTGKPTPDAANVINQAAGVKAAGATKTASAVKGTSTGSAGPQGGSAAANAADDTGSPAPIHPYVLAGVAVLAVGYGIYECRNDLGNKLHQFRTDRAARRKARS